MIYAPVVEAYFFKPQHVGELNINEEGVSHINVGLPSQGDYFVLYVLIDEKNHIIKACFKARGNPYLIAGVEWICCQLQGAAIESLKDFEQEELFSLFQMPERYLPTALLLEKGYNHMVKYLREKRKNE